MTKSDVRRAAIALVSLFYLTLWVGGIGWHLLAGTAPPDTQWAAPVFLLLAALIIAISASRPSVAGLIAAALFGFAAEVIGVWYGFLFGEYAYTDALSVKVFGVPLVMMAAWMALVAYVKQMTHFYGWPAWLEVAVASLWMTAIDLVIDPLAAGRLGYWRWAEAGSYYGIPGRNFAGWFAVSAVIFGFIWITFGRRWPTARAHRIVGLSVILFFTSLALIHGLALAATFGAALCMVHLATLYSRVARALQM